MNTNTQTSQGIEKSNKRVFILFALSMLLTPLMPVFFIAVIPMTMSLLSSEAKKSYSLLVFGLTLGLVMTWFGSVSVWYYGVFAFTALMSGLLSWQIKKGYHPGRIFFTTSLLASLIGVSGFLYQKNQGYSFISEVEKIEKIQKQNLNEKNNLTEQQIADFALLKQRVRIADKYAAPIIMGLLFINVWLVLYFILGSYQLYAPISEVKYTNLALVKFEFPFILIWFLVICLSLFLGSETLGLNSEVIDVILGVLAFLGSLFFIQGFSVLISFLNKFEVFGMLRTVIMVVSVFMFSSLISMLGIFEYWGEFRKKSEKKLNKV